MANRKCYVVREGEGNDFDCYGQPPEWTVAVYLSRESAIAELERWADEEGAVRIEGPYPYYQVTDGDFIDKYRCLEEEEDLLD